MNRLVPAAVAVLLPLALGCSRPVEPTQEAVARSAGKAESSPAFSLGSRRFYPLDLGNRWFYRQILVIRPDLPSVPFPPIVIRSEIDRDILCVEDRSGVEYAIEHIKQVDTTAIGPLTAHQWVRYRQDESGLYEADVDIGLPPECAPNQASQPVVPEGMVLIDAMRAAWKGSVEESSLSGAALQVAQRLRIVGLAAARAGRDGGPLAGEITRLRYPLRVGATWTVREAPHYTATVEASENLELAMGRVHAYRIRIDAPAILGPLDRMHFWYGHGGLLRMIVHIEIPTDLGTLLADENLVLEDLSIARGRF